MIVYATEEERVLAETLFPGEDCRRMGVGINAVQFLSNLPRRTPLINVGYAGGYHIPIGTKCTVTQCRMYHPYVQYKEPTFTLEPFDGLKPVFCYTSAEFVRKHWGEAERVFDMELAYMCALGFNVRSIKVISDNLSYKQYGCTIKAH